MDTAPPDQRFEAMAQVTLVNTVGLVAGPAIGGVLGHWDFRLPLGLALTLCVVTLITLWSSTLAGDVAAKTPSAYAAQMVYDSIVHAPKALRFLIDDLKLLFFGLGEIRDVLA